MEKSRSHMEKVEHSEENWSSRTFIHELLKSEAVR